MIAKLSCVAAACLIMANALVAGNDTADKSAPELVLTLADEGSCTRECCVLGYELQNRGSRAIYVCQWPGVLLSAHWMLADGKADGYAAGYPSTRVLPRKYFIELKPGEAIRGLVSAGEFPEGPTEITFTAEYHSDQSGSVYGLRAYTGHITAPPLTVHFR